MNPNESWIAEQARLLMLEDGFGPTPVLQTEGRPVPDPSTEVAT